MKATLIKLKDIKKQHLEKFKNAQNELSNIFEIDDYAAQVFFNINNEPCCIIFLNDDKTNTLINTWSDFDLIKSCKDITNDIISGKIINDFNDDDFKYLANEFRKENITVDTVLDKISAFGIDSLDKLDLYILKNN